MSYSDLRGNVKLPRYQRKLVWSPTEKKEFIETLHEGFPFGSILLYEYNNHHDDADNQDEKDKQDKRFTLIDGLQRYSTMRDFEYNPSFYYPIKGTFLEKIMAMLFEDIDSLTQTVRNRFEVVISGFLKEIVEGLDETSTFFLRDSLSYEFPDQITRTMEDDLVELQKDLIEDVKSYLNMEKVDIPYIEFLGDETQLADVFANLNRGGKKLSKYQVFAAQWYRHPVRLGEGAYSSEVLENVIHRYEALIDDREIEIDGFDAAEMRDEREINLSEFCGALGSLIVQRCPALFYGHSSEVGELKNVVGYASVAIALKVDNRKLHELVNKASLFDNEVLVEWLIDEILGIYLDINNTLQSRLRKPGIEDTYESAAISVFQIISFFASLWTIKFKNLIDVERMIPAAHYRTSYECARKNFIHYLLFDLVTGYWSGTGDTKIAQIHIEGENRYLRSLDQQRLENNIIEWHEDEVSKASINIGKVQKLIITIFTSFFSSELTEQKYDYEHILTKRGFLDKYYKALSIPGGSIGNVMFLDVRQNRSKGLKTLYEHTSEGQEYSRKYLESALYPTQAELESAKVALGLTSPNADEAIKIITNRGNDIINIILRSLYS